MAEKKSKILIILGIIAGIIFLSYAIYMLSLSISVRRRIERVSVTGYPVSLAEHFEQRASSPEADQNAYDLHNAMERIRDVYIKMNQDLWDKYEQDGIKFWDGHEWDDPGSVEIQGRYVMDNFELLLETREILNRSELLYPASTMTINEYFTIVIQTSRFQNTALQYYGHTGRHDEAFLIAEDMLRLAESLDKTTLYIANENILLQLNGYARNTLLMWEGVPTKELERIKNILIRAEDVIKDHNQSIFGLIEFIEIMQLPEVRSWHRVYFGIWHLEMIHFLDYFERLMDIEGAPINDRMDLIRDFYSRPKRQRLLAKLYYDIFDPLEISTSLSAYGLTSDIVNLARMRNARTAIATELFRRANGKWPENLEELVPAYLEEIPIDPFDGKPLKYRHMNEGEEFRAAGSWIVARNGVIIYSVGPDGSDNVGALGFYVNSIDDFHGRGYDIVFPLGDIERIEKP